MNDKMNKLSNIIRAALITLLVSALPVTAQEVDAESETLSRVVGLETEAVVAAIDLQTREVTLSLGLFQTTVYVPQQVIDLTDISVGDRVVGTYSASVESQLRAPTEEELAEPWEVLQEGAIAGDGEDLSVEKARVVRAVVTIAAKDDAKGLLVVTDSRGLMHFITHVEPEKMTGLATGQQVVVVFSEAMAITFAKKP